MEEKSIKKNYIFNTVYQVITICIPLFTAPYLSRVLGANGIGIQSYTNSIVSYFVLFAILGSSTFGQKKIASVRNNIDELTESFWNIVFFRAFMVLTTLIAYFIFIFFNKKYLIIYVVSVFLRCIAEPPLVLCFIVVETLLILLLSPVESVNKQITSKRRRISRNRSIWILLANVVVCIVFLWAHSNNGYIEYYLISGFLASSTMIAGKIKLHFASRKKEGASL